MSGYTPDKSTWLNPNIEYLFNSEVIEYDIKDAGFNLIQQYHLLSTDKIRELTKLGKGIERHIAIGKLQRDDKVLSKALSDKFAEVRNVFMLSNKLSDNDIISVKKDAIYTIGTCPKTKFGMVEFAPKNIYTSYVRFSEINNLEIYYSSDQMDIKGMGDHAINRHRLYMFDFLRKIISLIEVHDSKAKRLIKEFLNDYKSHNLDDEFYIEFNNLSKDFNPLFNYQKIILPLIQIIQREIV